MSYFGKTSPVSHISTSESSKEARNEMTTPFHVSTKDFENRVLGSPEPVVVDFWAEWCGPCRMMAPVLDQLAGELEGRVTFAKLNVDENPELSIRHGVEGIPTLIVFAEGKEVGRIVGFMPKELILRNLEALLPEAPVEAAQLAQ